LHFRCGYVVLHVKHLHTQLQNIFCFTGLNGVTGSMWDFVSGNFSPSPSPVLSSGTAPSVSSNSSGNELTRVRQELDDAKRKLKQWEESWQQVKQVCSLMVVLHFLCI